MGRAVLGAVCVVLVAGCHQNTSIPWDASPNPSTSPGASPTPTPGTVTWTRDITIPGGNITGTHNNFPVVLHLDGSEFASFDNGGHIAHPQAWDVRVYEDGIRQEIEIEEFDEVGRLVIWVRVESLAAGTDTTLEMEYGDLTASEPSNDPVAVWGPNYIGVWHLNDDVNDDSNSGIHVDSSSANNNGMQRGTNDLDGPIARGAEFDGTDYIEVNDTADLDYLDDATISMWVNRSNGTAAFLAKRTMFGTGYIVGMEFQDAGMSVSDTANDEYVVEADQNLPDGSWRYFVARYTAGVTIDVFLQGVEQANSSVGNIGLIDDGFANAATLMIGSNSDGASGRFNGRLDEVRIYAGLRSNSWIETEFANQDSPDTFYTVGPETEIPVGSN